MPATYEGDDLHPDVKPLSKREAAWVNRLERTLLACPTARLELVAWGDPTLQVVDGDVTIKHDFELADNGARDNRVLLADLNSRPNVSAVTN